MNDNDKEIINKINSNNRKNYILIDGSNLFFRSAFGMFDELLKYGFDDWKCVKYNIINEYIEYNIFKYKLYLDFLKTIRFYTKVIYDEFPKQIINMYLGKPPINTISKK
jgi:hypothetical protein